MIGPDHLLMRTRRIPNNFLGSRTWESDSGLSSNRRCGCYTNIALNPKSCNRQESGQEQPSTKEQICDTGSGSGTEMSSFRKATTTRISLIRSLTDTPRAFVATFLSDMLLDDTQISTEEPRKCAFITDIEGMSRQTTFPNAQCSACENGALSNLNSESYMNLRFDLCKPEGLQDYFSRP